LNSSTGFPIFSFILLCKKKKTTNDQKYRSLLKSHN
jgi:hypothetical protein